jgi:hypothetical protein
MKHIKIDTLIRASIQRIVINNYWERKIGSYKVSLQPEAFGRDWYLVMFVNNIRQPPKWKIVSLPIKGNIGWRGGYYTADQESYYLLSNGKRRKFIYIDPIYCDIGTIDEFAARGINLRYRQRSREAKPKTAPITNHERDLMMKTLFPGNEIGSE